MSEVIAIGPLQKFNLSRRGAVTLEKIARRCDGAGTDCGSCRSEIQTHLEACRQQQVA